MHLFTFYPFLNVEELFTRKLHMLQFCLICVRFVFHFFCCVQSQYGKIFSVSASLIHHT